MARFQMEISDKGMRDIEELMEKSGLSSKKDFINNAVTLLKWAIRESEQGRKIRSYSEDDDASRELQMPILEEVFDSSKNSLK